MFDSTFRTFSNRAWLLRVLGFGRKSEASYLVFDIEACEAMNNLDNGVKSIREEGSEPEVSIEVRDDIRTPILQSRHFPNRFVCHGPKDVEVHCDLLSGHFTSTGIGLSVLFTKGSTNGLSSTKLQEPLHHSGLRSSKELEEDVMDAPKSLRNFIRGKRAKSGQMIRWNMMELALSRKDVRRWNRASKPLQREYETEKALANGDSHIG